MPGTTTGRFRVLDGPREDGWLFLRVDREDPERAFEPTYLPATGHGDLDPEVATLYPGYLVEATVDWSGEDPRLTALEVLKRTLFEFVDDATNVFEAATAAWTSAAATGDAMNSQVTYSTDGDPNGVLYVFAQQSGAQDLLEEFRTGARPLEPLLDRVNESDPDAVGTREPETPTVSADGTIAVPTPDDAERGDDGDSPDHGLGRDREVFVMRPADHPFVLVYIVLRKGGLLADTMRDTYHCPRPETDGDPDG
jgi:hypothetical protein